METDKFVIDGQKWGDSQVLGTPGGTVNVNFDVSGFSDFSSEFGSVYRQETRIAFEAWSDVADIQFNYLPDSAPASSADITVGFAYLDGGGGTLGVASTPIYGPLQDVTIRMDVSENWFTGGDAPSTQTDFSAVMMHEVGHAIGIGHSDVSSALMYDTYRPSVLDLRPDDIDAAQTIYGPADGSGGGATDSITPDGPNTNGTIRVGATVQNTLETGDDQDWYAVSLLAGNTYRVELSGVGDGELRDPLVGVADDTGFILAADDDDGPGLDSALDFVPSFSGTYYLIADNFGDTITGDYALSITNETPDDVGPDNVNTNASLRPSQALTGALEVLDDQDWYEISLQAGHTYRFGLRGTGDDGELSDPLVRLADSNGNEIAFNDDGGSGLDSLLTYTPTSGGTYYLIADNFGDSSTGTYRISANDVTSPDQPTLRADGSGDFNGDGTDDILWQNPSTGAVGQYQMTNGNAAWDAIGIAGNGYQFAGTGDFNGDGTDDVLWTNPGNNRVGQFEMSNGNASWQPIARSGGNFEAVGTGDFNGDGTDDILWINSVTGAVGQHQMSNGNASWDFITSSSGSFVFSATGDFDGDGTDDLFWRNSSTGQFGQHQMSNGNASWDPLGTAGGNFSFAGTGDFDGDNAEELLWVNPSNGQVGFHDVSGGGVAWNGIGTAGGNYTVAGTGDYTGDGSDEVLWYNSNDGRSGLFEITNGQASWQPLGQNSGNFSPLANQTDDGLFG